MPFSHLPVIRGHVTGSPRVKGARCVYNNQTRNVILVTGQDLTKIASGENSPEPRESGFSENFGLRASHHSMEDTGNSQVRFVAAVILRKAAEDTQRWLCDVT